MGNDGGSIPKRRELVKNAARAPTVSELKATALESQGHAWKHCALTGLPLDLAAVVSDWRGRLYSYEHVLRGMIPAAAADEGATNELTPASLGIRSIRDVARLKFSQNGDKWVCPISMKELGPAAKAVYIVPCGHVFAEVAMAEINERACPECAEEYSSDNLLPILPATDKEVEQLKTRIEKLRAQGLTHTLKKDKSEKKKKRKGADVKQEEEQENGKTESGTKSEKVSGRSADARISGINNPMAASLTARVLAEQDEMNKRRKLATDGAPRRKDAIRG